jgi:negative regulator of sigma E activity
MLWFYWRRVRFLVLATGVALSSIAALIVIAGSVSPAASRTAARKTLASRVSAAQLRRAGQVPVEIVGVRRGVRLMAAAAAACRRVSYSGLQMVAWWGADDSTGYLIGVWHRAGEPEVADGIDGTDADMSVGSIAEPGMAAADHATAGVLSVSPWMLNLLQANYLIQYAGVGVALGRVASIVAVRRHDGSLAARYWLDRATGLPLRREMFDLSGRLVNEGAFIDLTFGGSAPGVAPSKGTQAWSTQSARSDLPRLRHQGWPVPPTLAGNMSLVSLSRESLKSGVVVDASYSDGLSVVSVFMQHGELAGALPGWSEDQVRGMKVYSSEPDQRSLAWSAAGVVFTVISDAPQTAVDRIVAQLPHEHDIGIWRRIGRGLARIGSWFNPFG